VNKSLAAAGAAPASDVAANMDSMTTHIASFLSENTFVK
jgi:hypothetical protein